MLGASRARLPDSLQGRKVERKQLAKVTQPVQWPVWLQSLSRFAGVGFEVPCLAPGPVHLVLSALALGTFLVSCSPGELQYFPPWLQGAVGCTSQEHRAGVTTKPTFPVRSLRIRD